MLTYTAHGHMQPILTPRLKFDPLLDKTVLQCANQWGASLQNLHKG